MQTVTYRIPAIHCAHCVHTIQSEVAELAGVASVQVEERSKSAAITFGPPATEEQIVALLKEIYYPPAGQDRIQIA